MNSTDILSRFESVKEISTNQFEALCPAHNDTKPSLHIKIEQDRMLLNCKAGCHPEDVLNKVGLKLPDLFFKNGNGAGQLTNIIYNFHTEDGNIIYQKHRKPDKTFTYSRKDQEGKTIYGLKGIHQVLYRLPQLIKAVKDDKYIWFCEGEKDADNLAKYGIEATTSGAVTSWKKEFIPYFKNAKVILCGDNDQPGKEFISKVATDIIPVAKEVKYINLEKLNLQNKEDISDYISNLVIKEEKTPSEITELLLKLQDEADSYGIEEPAVDATPAVESSEETDTPFKFWNVEVAKDKSIIINYFQLYEFIKSIGIKQIYISEKTKLLVQVKSNIVKEIELADIKTIATDYLKSLPDVIDGIQRDKLVEHFIKGINVYVEQGKIDAMFGAERLTFQKDTKDIGYFYFLNGYIEVNKDGYALKDYSTLTNHIWQSQIIEFNITPDTDTDNVSDFFKFTRNTCTHRETGEVEELRWKTLISCIGYLLHSYKSTSNLYSVVFSEASTDDQPQGRTGKGLLMQAIGKLRKISRIDGKNFNPDNQFSFQGAGIDTSIIFFDDIVKHFNFQRLFSVITEGLSFEKKHQDRITLKPEESPKIVVSTNYSVRGNSESDKARKFEMELLNYYSSTHKPIDDFKREFFNDWDNDEWNLFYNFMFNCLVEHLVVGSKIPKYESNTLELKKLTGETSEDFVTYADNLKRNQNLNKNDTYNDYLNFIESDKKSFSDKMFTKWIKVYCSYKNLKYLDKTNGKIRTFLLSEAKK